MKTMELMQLTEIQEKLLEVLKTNGDLKREEICEHLGFESYILKYNLYYPSRNLRKTIYPKKIQLHSRRTTVHDNLDKLLKKGLVTKYQKHNGKRGRPSTYWKLQTGSVQN